MSPKSIYFMATDNTLWLLPEMSSGMRCELQNDSPTNSFMSSQSSVTGELQHRVKCSAVNGPNSENLFHKFGKVSWFQVVAHAKKNFSTAVRRLLETVWIN